MIKVEHKEISVRRQSELLKINRSMLYYEGSGKTENFELSNMIAEIYAKHPIYGYRRIRAMLQRENVAANHKKVQRLMKEMNLYAIYPRPNTSKRNVQASIFQYLLNDLSITKAHQVWQVDITYIRTMKGFMYLVAIIDMHSRMIMGYRISNSLCTESCICALEDAVLKYGVPKIINSDQGAQFTSEAWIKKLDDYGIKVSMTSKGRCCDNAHIERLWRAFKYEGLHLYQWNTVEELKLNIPKWVNWYNYKRPHQSLNYSTPAEVMYGAYCNDNSCNFYLNLDKLQLVQEVKM